MVYGSLFRLSSHVGSEGPVGLNATLEECVVVRGSVPSPFRFRDPCVRLLSGGKEEAYLRTLVLCLISLILRPSRGPGVIGVSKGVG